MRKKVVLIGGGTGSNSVLKGLKKYISREDNDDSIDLSSIVAMTDSGGSSGVLRKKYDMLPLGDVRQCLAALSDDSETIKALLQHRFDEKLDKHSFGNLFLTALTEMFGSEEKAVKEAEKLLKIKGRVIPVTYDKANLCAELEDGTILPEEAQISHPRQNPPRISRLYLDPIARANPEALNAIKEADIIFIGPGSLYASVCAVLLVDGIADAINSSKALKVYNCNIMTKHGETDNFSVKDHLMEIEKYVNVDLVTYSTTKISKKAIDNYQKENAHLVKPSKLRNAIGFDLAKNPIVRHDSEKTAKALMKIIFD